MKNEYTEQEAIQITIDHGYDGAEFNTSTWKKRSCLQTDRTMKALISKLETIYHNVEVTGRGRKRTYILSNKKNEVTEREFNYKGTVPTAEDEIMKEYIFNKLVKYKNGFTQSYKGWADILNFPNIDKINIEEMISVIKDIHLGFPTIYNPKEVVSKFIQFINIRNKDVIEKSFKRLQKENRIQVTEIFYFKNIEGKYIEVSQSEYDMAQESLKDFIHSQNVTYYAYSQAITSFHNSTKMKEVIKEVKNFLLDYFGIQFFFKAFSVTVVNKETKQDVPRELFQKSYYDRLVKLSQDRQNKDDYRNSTSFWKRFYLLNTLTLLKYINVNVNGYKEIMKKEKNDYFDNVNFYEMDIAIINKELKEQREIRRHTFGAI